MTGNIRKAVFPVAGLGTRFLPAAKSVPKEMLPIMNRPLIQYAVDEAIDAWRFQGTRFDCGTHLGLVEATVRFALDHETISDAARASMTRALRELGVVDLD